MVLYMANFNSLKEVGFVKTNFSFKDDDTKREYVYSFSLNFIIFVYGSLYDNNYKITYSYKENNFTLETHEKSKIKF